MRATCFEIGIAFDPWQEELNRAILAKDSFGLYAADTVALSIPRQVGKTFDVGAVVFALCIQNPRLTVVWTAHRFKVSRETFNELRGLAKSPKLAAHIEYDDITTAAGNECIPFRNGSRIVFAARERGAIRGFTKVGVLVLDEAQILTDSVLADLAPTMNQAENPLIIMMGTPPKPSDPGEVFSNLRADAIAGSSEGVLYVELSAPANCDPDDRDAWRIANPSFPSRTPERAILRLQKLLSAEDFMREALGVWDDLSVTGVIPAEAWDACRSPSSKIVGQPSFSVDVSPLRDWSTIAVAGMTDDDRIQVEVIDVRPGTAWVVDRVADICSTWGAYSVSIHAGQAAESLIPGLEDADLEVVKLSGTEMAQACGAFHDAATSGRLAHLDDPVLNSALRGAKRLDRDGAFTWARRKSAGDITPLYAVTLAAWGAQNERLSEPSIYFI